MIARRFFLLVLLAAAPLAFLRAEPQPETPKPGGYINAGFSRLASYELPNVLEDDPAKLAALYNQHIPAEIKALDGKKTVISGFMLPVKVNKGVVTELLLMKDQQSCCYGATPNLNDFVIVRMPEGKGKLMVDTPIFIYGTLKVGAVLENGFLAGLYQLDGEKMEM